MKPYHRRHYHVPANLVWLSSFVLLPIRQWLSCFNQCRDVYSIFEQKKIFSIAIFKSLDIKPIKTVGSTTTVDRPVLGPWPHTTRLRLDDELKEEKTQSDEMRLSEVLRALGKTPNAAMAVKIDKENSVKTDRDERKQSGNRNSMLDDTMYDIYELRNSARSKKKVAGLTPAKTQTFSNESAVPSPGNKCYQAGKFSTENHPPDFYLTANLDTLEKQQHYGWQSLQANTFLSNVLCLPTEKEKEPVPTAKEKERAPTAKEKEHVPTAKEKERVPTAKEKERVPTAKEKERVPTVKEKRTKVTFLPKETMMAFREKEEECKLPLISAISRTRSIREK
ncbi:hypothetical protein GCK32_003828 [Trichostrongylus colubriformis]|uniref:Uncharacterized protein n=1 Tax=Trichostrongylus colubriformis TaxID=6319 RepID=A0AAN8FQ13_TRICO